jgi:hypothetical protein
MLFQDALHDPTMNAISMHFWTHCLIPSARAEYLLPRHTPKSLIFLMTATSDCFWTNSPNPWQWAISLLSERTAFSLRLSQALTKTQAMVHAPNPCGPANASLHTMRKVTSMPLANRTFPGRTQILQTGPHIGMRFGSHEPSQSVDQPPASTITQNPSLRDPIIFGVRDGAAPAKWRYHAVNVSPLRCVLYVVYVQYLGIS